MITSFQVIFIHESPYKLSEPNVVPIKNEFNVNVSDVHDKENINYGTLKIANSKKYKVILLI